MSQVSKRIGAEAELKKGWWAAHQWLVLRRIVQLSILTLFIVGTVGGIAILKGNLASSMVLGFVPLTDPFLILQSLFAGHFPYQQAWIGAGIVLAFYLLVGGRVFCSWVCPMNMVTDAAAALRRRLGLKGGHVPPAQTRYWLLGFVLLAAALTGRLAWEWVNPVSMLHRGLVFGFGLAWGVVGSVFLYDLLLGSRGWCGHVCPQGAMYAILGRAGLVRVSASKRSACNDCMDCFAVCPEPHVIRPALKAVGQTHPIILSGACTNCARCIDVCSERVFKLSTRFSRSVS